MSEYTSGFVETPTPLEDYFTIDSQEGNNCNEHQLISPRGYSYTIKNIYWKNMLILNFIVLQINWKTSKESVTELFPLNLVTYISNIWMKCHAKINSRKMILTLTLYSQFFVNLTLHIQTSCYLTMYKEPLAAINWDLGVSLRQGICFPLVIITCLENL